MRFSNFQESSKHSPVWKYSRTLAWLLYLQSAMQDYRFWEKTWVRDLAHDPTCVSFRILKQHLENPSVNRKEKTDYKDCIVHIVILKQHWQKTVWANQKQTPESAQRAKLYRSGVQPDESLPGISHKMSVKLQDRFWKKWHPKITEFLLKFRCHSGPGKSLHSRVPLRFMFWQRYPKKLLKDR